METDDATLEEEGNHGKDEHKFLSSEYLVDFFFLPWSVQSLIR